MKKLIIVSALLCSLLFMPIFASAQTAPTSAQLTQQLIQTLTQLIAQLQQQIQQILAQKQAQTSASNQTTPNTTSVSNQPSSNCVQNYQLECYDNSVYEYDSCGNQESLYQTCTSNQTCSNGKCTGSTPVPAVTTTPISTSQNSSWETFINQNPNCSGNLSMTAESLCQAEYSDYLESISGIISYPKQPVVNNYQSPPSVSCNGSVCCYSMGNCYMQLGDGSRINLGNTGN